jgi:hypothetical protein
LPVLYIMLLDMQAPRRPSDWSVIGREGDYPRLAFEAVENYRPPRWPDPAYPKQIHLDICMPDVAASRLACRDAARTHNRDVGHR